MAFSIRIGWDDLNIRQYLERLRRAQGDLQGLNDHLGALITSGIQGHFESETGPDGRPWEKSIRAAIEGGQTLTDTGDLAQSISYRAGADYVEVGTNLIYAAIHQSGGEIRPVNAKALRFQLPGGAWVNVGKVTIPARPFIGISAATAREIGNVVIAWMSRLAGGQK